MEYITLVITIVLGLPGIVIFFKQRKTKLLFMQEKVIHFQEDLLENFTNLEILYDGIPVSDKLTYIKGSVLCSGTKDIVENKNYLQIIHNGSDWLNFKITSHSKGLEIDSLIDNNKAIVNFGYVKNKEFFEFEGIINGNKTPSNQLKLKFFHRIPNVPPVKKITKSSIESAPKVLLSGILYCAMSLFMLNWISKIETFNLKAYDSVKNESTSVRPFEFGSEYKSLLKKVDDEYWGLELFFTPTKVYTFEYREWLSSNNETKKVSLYFKRNDYYTLAFAIILSFILMYGLLNIYLYSTVFNYRDYFNKTNNYHSISWFHRLSNIIKSM
jgi:hypothetical protein